MTIGIIGMTLFGSIGFLFYVGAFEQLGTITDPKTLKRISYLFFVLAFLSAMLDSTPTP